MIDRAFDGVKILSEEVIGRDFDVDSVAVADKKNLRIGKKTKYETDGCFKYLLIK